MINKICALLPTTYLIRIMAAFLFSLFIGLYSFNYVVADHGQGSLCTDGSIILDDEITCSDQGKEAVSPAVQSACHNAGGPGLDSGERQAARFNCIQQQRDEDDEGATPSTGSAALVPCTPEGGGSFLGISPWYKYLDEGRQGAEGECNLHISSLNDIWKIVLAVLDALLRVAAYVAVGFMIFAGFIYMTSNGNPEKTKQALGTIRLSAIGLIITIASSLIVSFIAGRF